MPLVGGKRNNRNKSGYNFERCWLFSEVQIQTVSGEWGGGRYVEGVRGRGCDKCRRLKVKVPQSQSLPTPAALPTAPSVEIRVQDQVK